MSKEKSQFDDIDLDKVDDNPDYIFDWVITYKDGKKEAFRGFADEAFEQALKTSKMFAVEKADTDFNNKDQQSKKADD